MSNFLRDNSDLLYYLDKGLDWAPLVELGEYGYRDPEGFASLEEAREFYRETLEAIGQFVAEQVAPASAEIDRAGVRLENGEVVTCEAWDRIFAQINDLELHGMSLPRSLDGLNCPMVVYFMAIELFARADVAVMSHWGFHGGIAAAMMLFSVTEGSTEFGDNPWEIKSTRFNPEIAEILAGKAWGCMDITESDAGSDMAALRTKGEQDEDGNWFVTGQKIFITSGHGKYHFVIARTEEAKSTDLADGLKGLSMFMVPTYEEQGGEKVWLATVDRLEEKLGHHGSVTASISFDRTPAKLVGERGEGFKYMLVLMNNARVGVGFEGIGVCESAYRLARAYAADRPSMGKTIDQHEMIADYLDEMDSDLIGMRAMAMVAGYHEEMAQKLGLGRGADTSSLESKRDERAIKKHKRISRRLTPLLKFIAGEKGVEFARRCVQIHGGNGYMKEYGAEKLLRDSLVLPIYEGTSQIQSLMAMKDTLSGIMANPQAFVRRVAQTRWRALSARDPLERRVAKLQQVSLSVQQHLITKTATDKFRSLEGPITEWPQRFVKNWDPKRDFAYAMLHAERLARLLVDEAICEILLDQATSHPERRRHLEDYLERAEPRCRYLADQITHTGHRLLDRLVGRESGSEKATG